MAAAKVLRKMSEITASVSPSITVGCEPLPVLRWKDGVLQQQFRIIQYVGVASNYEFEWRDVPSADGD